MARTLLTDDIWQQIQSTMQFHGCYCSKNSRNIMEAILWKLRTGATWRDIPEEFCPWKTAYNRFNRWACKGLWDKFFLNYEAYWIKNGYSLTEATYARISMQVELGMVSSEQLDSLEVEEPQKSILQPTRMDYRLILKSLEVKSMTAKLQRSWFVRLVRQITWLQIKAMIRKKSEYWQESKILCRSSQWNQIAREKTKNLISIYIA